MNTDLRHGRFLLLLTLMAAMLLACTGVVLAQTTDEPRAAGKPPSPSTQAAQKARAIPDHYIVVLNEEATQAAERSSASDDPARAAEQAAEQVSGNLARAKGIEVTQTYGNALKGFAAKIPPGKLDAVRSDPRVDFVTQDREVRGSAQLLPFGTNRADADLSTTRAGNGAGAVNADVAILDSGIRKTATGASHADLNVRGGYNCLSTNRSDWGDAHGHGTHVAGTAAAKDNTIGVVGTAPGARLWAIRVLDSQNSGTWSQIICGVNRVTAMNKDSVATNNIEVANMSLGGRVTEDGSADDRNCGRTNNDALHKAICASVAARITYVTSAGNDGEHTDNYIPASYGEVITVSALADYNGRPFGGAANFCGHDPQPDDDFAFFSNFGPDVDIGAPGVCILSTSRSGGYEIMSGTSMASPHVAGAAALFKSRFPGATPATVRSFMISRTNSEALGQGHMDSFGFNPEPVLQMDNY
jgi:subtilisin family serine protease